MTRLLSPLLLAAWILSGSVPGARAQEETPAEAPVGAASDPATPETPAPLPVESGERVIISDVMPVAEPSPETLPPLEVLMEQVRRRPIVRLVSTLDRDDLSTEQGRTSLDQTFTRDPRAPDLKTRADVIEDTRFEVNSRTMFFDRDKFDGSESEALATGGWIGARTGYLLQRLSFGVTGYTTQKIEGAPAKDGTLMLEPVQAGYTVLGEAYADLIIADGLNLFAGRKGFDTPFINRNDTRMVPNSFEALALMGLADLGPDGDTLKYGIGWFEAIKDRDSGDFVSMGIDAGAPVERGVLGGGALYTRDRFSFGAIDYHSADLINIFYAESKLELPIQLPIADNAVPRLAVQVVDQRSTGANLLTGAEFQAQQFGFKGELPVNDWLFTTGYTIAGSGDVLRAPWSGYPGYTSVQVEDFNRPGEGALILRAAYDFPCFDGLSAYGLFVNGSTPDVPGQFRKNEVDLNLQWAPTECFLEGFSLRFRYAVVEEHGPATRDLSDFRVICNYFVEF